MDYLFTIGVYFVGMVMGSILTLVLASIDWEKDKD